MAGLNSNRVSMFRFKDEAQCTDPFSSDSYYASNRPCYRVPMTLSSWSIRISGNK